MSTRQLTPLQRKSRQLTIRRLKGWIHKGNAPRKPSAGFKSPAQFIAVVGDAADLADRFLHLSNGKPSKAKARKRKPARSK